MLKQLTQLTRHSAIYGMGHILGRSIGILLLPLHTNFIPPTDYALYVAGYAFIPFAAILFSAGINAAQLRFYIAAQTKAEKKQIFSTSFWGTALFAGVLTIAMVFFADPLAQMIFGQSETNEFIYLSVCILFFDALNLLLFNLLRADERSVAFVLISTLQLVINIFLNFVLLLVFHTGVYAIFIAAAISSLVAFIILIFVNLQMFQFSFQRMQFLAMLRFGFPLMPATLALVIILAVDRFFIRAYLGNEAVALYGAGYKLGSFMSLFVTAFKYAWHPFYLSLAESDDKAPEVFGRVMTYFLFVTCSVFILISLFINELVLLKIGSVRLFGEAYWGGTIIVPFILASYIFHGIFLNLQVGSYIKNKTQYLAISTIIGASINILLNVLWIPHFGIIGAASATLVAYMSLALSLYLCTFKMYAIPYEWERLSKLAVITAIIFIINQFSTNQLAISTRMMLVALFYLLLYLTGFFLKGEQKAIKNLLQKLK